mmetsp:Transcript_1507/g.3497  ORF Transcript_1507/g.3497 Transcript_1507/m.3497 type:complete len:177 (+) Transcript_1507:648-1178(+)
MLAERLLPFRLPLGDLLVSFPLGGEGLEDRRGDLLSELVLFLLSLSLDGDLPEGRRGDLLGERLMFFSLPLRGDLPEEREETLPCDLLSNRRLPRSCLEEITFGGDRDRSRLPWRPSPFLRLFDNDEDGDLDLLEDLLRSPRLFSFVIIFGGDRDRPLVLLRRLSSFLPRLLDLES